jgi:hypothetical protein
VWWIGNVHASPAYASEYLPGMVVSGAGVGLVIPTLTGAGTSSLAPERFATGAAVLTMGRQVGSALGIAILVAVLGAGAGTIADFHSAWLISAIGGLGTALVFAAFAPARRASRATESAPASAPGSAGQAPGHQPAPGSDPALAGAEGST